MMDGLRNRSNKLGSSSNVELSKLDKHSNSCELDPLTGTTTTSDFSRKLNERVQSDVEKLKDGSIHRHRYKLHESNENTLNKSTNLVRDDKSPSRNSSSRLTGVSLPSRISATSKSPLDSTSSLSNSSRMRRILDDDDDDDLIGRRSRIKNYEPIGARLASDLGIDVKNKPVSFNYECDAKRRAHELLLKEIDDEDEKFRTLPFKDTDRYKVREQQFANDWDARDLRYLSREGRQDLIRPTQPAVTAEQPFRHKRKSKYAKFMEGF